MPGMDPEKEEGWENHYRISFYRYLSMDILQRVPAYEDRMAAHKCLLVGTGLVSSSNARIMKKLQTLKIKGEDWRAYYYTGAKDQDDARESGG